MGDWEDAQGEMNSGGTGFYKPQTLPPGESQEITVVRYAKWTQTKYPIKDKQGQSLGYTWRFFLADGRVWDVGNRNRKVLIAGLHPDGTEKVVAGRFKVTQVGDRGTKAPAQDVVYLGVATPATDGDVPF